MIKNVRRVGGSGIISLAKYFKEAGIEEGDYIEVIAEYGKVLIRKVELKPVGDNE